MSSLPARLSASFNACISSPRGTACILTCIRGTDKVARILGPLLVVLAFSLIAGFAHTYFTLIAPSLWPDGYGVGFALVTPLGLFFAASVVYNYVAAMRTPPGAPPPAPTPYLPADGLEDDFRSTPVKQGVLGGGASHRAQFGGGGRGGTPVEVSSDTSEGEEEAPAPRRAPPPPLTGRRGWGGAASAGG